MFLKFLKYTLVFMCFFIIFDNIGLHYFFKGKTTYYTNHTLTNAKGWVLGSLDSNGTLDHAEDLDYYIKDFRNFMSNMQENGISSKKPDAGSLNKFRFKDDSSGTLNNSEDLEYYIKDFRNFMSNLRENVISSKKPDAESLNKIRFKDDSDNINRTLTSEFLLHPDVPEYNIKVFSERIYIYAAVVSTNVSSRISSLLNGTKRNVNSFIALNGWRHIASKPDLKCCYMLDNMAATEADQLFPEFTHSYNSTLKSVQYRCPVISPRDRKVIGVGLSRIDLPCSQNLSYYLRPSIVAKYRNGSIGMCCKLSFGSVEPSKLIEWFEAQSYFGVDKIFTYISNVSKESQIVFEYYRSIGLLEFFPFDIPEKDLDPRQMGGKVIQAWTDEQVVIQDCQERMGAFEYAVFLDKDEFLVPKKLLLRNALKRYFFDLPEGIGGQKYFGEIHLTDWPKMYPDHPLMIGQYALGSKPVVDTTKYMFRPSRYPPAACIAHSIPPKDPLEKLRFADRDTITVHHFRSCNTDRHFFKNGTFCREAKRHPAVKLLKLADILTNAVSEKLDQLNLPKSKAFVQYQQLR